MKFFNLSSKQIFSQFICLLIIFQLISSAMIMRRKKNKLKRVTPTHSLKIGIYSWNVGEQDPPKDLSKFASKDNDVIAVGLQETVKLGLKNIVFSDNEIKKEYHLWETRIKEELNKHGKYSVLEFKNTRWLVGISLFLFIKDGLKKEVSELEGMRIKTGVHGLLGNKGSVNARFKFGAKSYSFSCVHLTAGDESHSERMKELNELFEKKYSKCNKLVKDHDVQIVFGDLNSRTDYSSSNKAAENEQTKQKIHSQDFSFFKNDQLHKALAESVLKGMKEGEIKFAPTYKFDPNTDNYDTSKKQRIPSWCDRVIYRDTAVMKNAQKVYTNIPELKMSDHKPIYSEFHIPV